MSDSLAISVQNVSKKYRLYNSPKERLWEVLHPLKKKYHKEFWALQDIRFEVPKGTTLGIIGRNGSGKSTLLQIICSVLRPTQGEVKVQGRISALLELGAGFNPEFTGRENVMLNGALMGFSRQEILERLPQIESFADIGQFIDQPVKVYSSGMFARLAFAAAINVDPDILVVDEALSVGDAKFQHKCYQKFHEFQEAGKTILFVTHDTNAIVKHCDQAILLENGSILENGKPKKVVDIYLNLVLTGSVSENIHPAEKTSLSSEAKMDVSESDSNTARLNEFFVEIPENDHCVNRKNYNINEYRLGDGRASIVDFLFVSEGKVEPSSLVTGDQVDIYIKAMYHSSLENLLFGFAIKTVDGVMVSGSNTRFRKILLEPVNPKDMVVYRFTIKMNLHPGDYFIDLGIAEKTPIQDKPLDVRKSLIHITVSHKNRFDGLVDLELDSREITRLSTAQKITD